MTQNEIDDIKNGLVTLKQLGEARDNDDKNKINKWNTECWEK